MKFIAITVNNSTKSNNIKRISVNKWRNEERNFYAICLNIKELNLMLVNSILIELNISIY